METRVLAAADPPSLEEAVREAVRLLRAGQPVALPTETVYGLAADALDAGAVARIFATKERPHFDPLIVHVPTKAALGEVASEITPTVARLVETFWPGPLTVVVPRASVVPDLVTAGLDTVAVRMSAHPIFRKVIRGFGGPLAAPSANRFGRVSPTSASAVVEELGGRIPLVIDGGASTWGLESTIVRVDEVTPEAVAAAEQAKAAGRKKVRAPKPLIRVLRAGPVTPDELKRFGKVVVERRRPGVDAGESGAGDRVEAPGSLASHYAPRTPFRLVEDPEAFVPEPGKRYALLSYRGEPKDGLIDRPGCEWAEVFVLSPGSGRLPEAAVRLFHAMRRLDASGVDEIVAERVGERGLGIAIMDRLRRAAHATVAGGEGDA